MDLVLIRHATVSVAAGVCYGRSDVPLADEPATAAAAVVARLAALRAPQPGDTLFTSPLTRCASIANLLAAHFDCACRIDTRLEEMNFGAWEMQRWDAIDRAQLDAWTADFEHAQPHGGESVAQFAARVGAWLDDVVVARKTSPVAYVVTHAGVMRVVTALALELPVERCVQWALEMAAIVWLRRDEVSGRWTLVRWNA
ncbi:alpha-ribazole phosphatase [Paraburkholderia acidicola]|uniref:Alpha-ribazole phosphatase n=1 Tax=Paraburkholderia acidicola TaxID=1912599 RepID=A0A2A4EXI0_9BURK|nr:alpha-ribazole phosphatase [Paraburkholderia acidicola]PCE25130.1 alpha-ribazole phosphatase [Paraburkholderia acidicola]